MSSPHLRLIRGGSRSLWLGVIVCCFLGIFSFRAFMIERFGASVPLVHEWEATGLDVLAEWHRGTLTFDALIEAHNGDHPTAATRLWEIFWFEINGDWDPKLVMITKAAVFAAAAAIFIHLLTAGLGRWRYVAAGAFAGLFAFPFNWQNLLWAVASQFDFLFLAAALGLLALKLNRPALALVFSVLALFTNGAGPILAVCYLPFFAAAGFSGQWSWRRTALYSAIALSIVLQGLALHTAVAEPHVGALADQGATLAKLHAWPFSNLLGALERLPELARMIPAALLNFPSAGHSWLLLGSEWLAGHRGFVTALNVLVALAIIAPVPVVLMLAWRRQIAWRTLHGPLLVTAFAYLMMAATAFARAGQTTIAVRFLDHVALGGFCALAAGGVLFVQQPRLRRWLAIWAGVVACGYLFAGCTTFKQLGQRYPASCLSLVQRYYATHDVGVLTENEAYKLLGFERNVQAFLAFFDAPLMQPVLPRAVTAPAAGPRPVAALAYGFARSGLWIALLSAFTAGGAIFLARRQGARAEPAAPELRLA